MTRMEKKYLLCKEVERHVRREMKEHKDFMWMSKEIASHGCGVLGVNTLKRLWGIEGYEHTAPQQGTLNVLASFLGYRNFEHFTSVVQNESSDQLIMKHLDTWLLEPGLSVRCTWLPDRICTFRHDGQSQFTVTESQNSKLAVGDTFECRLIIEGEPLYLSNLVHNGMSPVSYIAGRQQGVHFDVTED